ncbi:hypothetical protein LJR153_002237 [Paenibacillus sp. LjRoot153]|uniref:hypothetical protein n=1 Tax=Paenibacillus sp. LjRoot153 TaxID=3342270 RepID=UPI003ECCDB2A
MKGNHFTLSFGLLLLTTTIVFSMIYGLASGKPFLQLTANGLRYTAFIVILNLFFSIIGMFKISKRVIPVSALIISTSVVLFYIFGFIKWAIQGV